MLQCFSGIKIKKKVDLCRNGRDHNNSNNKGIATKEALNATSASIKEADKVFLVLPRFIEKIF